MKNMFSLRTGIGVVVVLLISAVISFVLLILLHVTPQQKTKAVAIRSLSSDIQADGAIAASDQATLHFQLGGKLVYLPFKEGDTVKKGQTIASLDTTTLQKQVTQALNTYQSTRDTFDQSAANSANSVLQGQQKVIANTAGVNGDLTDVVNDAAKRILDQNQASLNNAVLSVEIAQQALQLGTITSPLNGVITHMDVTTANVNVTPTTSFVVADPDTLVFRAMVLENDIDYISIGSSVTIKLGNDTKGIFGTVTKIYPDKVTLSSGQKAYQVDIQSDGLSQRAKLGQEGTVLIQSNIQTTAKIVPTWTILNHDVIWVVSGGKPVLRHVSVGKVHGDMTEILSGLHENDLLITNPQSIAAANYHIL